MCFSEGLVDHAVAFGELGHRGQLLLVGVRIELEPEADRREPDGRVAIDAERPTKVEVRLGPAPCPDGTLDPQGGGYTALSVTPAQATSASSSMSPEHSSVPSPPLAGCSPACAIARPVWTEHDTPLPSTPLAESVSRAASGLPCSGPSAEPEEPAAPRAARRTCQVWAASSVSNSSRSSSRPNSPFR